MDFYADLQKKASILHDEIVDAISTVLTEKGYRPGTSKIVAGEYEIEWLNDRILVCGDTIRNQTHTDHIEIELLLKILRNTYHLWPNI